MPSRATFILAALLLMVTAVLIDACYNATPPPPAMPLTPEVTPPPRLEEEPEAEETPPPPWPVGHLAEQDITPEVTDTATPTETATPTDTPFGQTPGPTPSPSPTPTESPRPTETPEPTPQPDFSQNLPPGQLSDQSLDGEINATAMPTRQTSMRIADQARRELLKHDPDEAIRTLGRALSIDAADPFVYFYLGRAYLMKHNYDQALTFWQRAAISFADNPKWLGETLSFEAAAKERLGNTDEARTDYARAIKLAPDNQLAKDGYARLGPPPPPPEAEPTESGPIEAEPPPAEETPAPPPAASEPPPAEESAPGAEEPPSEEEPMPSEAASPAPSPGESPGED
jgi:Tetratricopeptide repeat